MWWSVVQSSPVPSRLVGKITVWKGMLSLPTNWNSFTSFGAIHHRFHSGVCSAVMEMYPIGASNQT